jgi:exodeoxyribonuclease V alpha subunit
MSVQEIEAVTVRHYTSRAGDPHRHLHLQINARVLAEGSWRGLHTIGIRDSLDAINGIGHAAVMTDPAFRSALAAHGFTLDPNTGEVVQLVEFVGPFSARAAQIGRNLDRYERQWCAANPGQEPGPGLRRAWDARAWVDARPDKIVPRDGAELTQRWVHELQSLGYRHHSGTARVAAVPVAELDRNQAVTEVLSRLAARRSGWNAADIRGEVEQLIARRNVVTEAAIRNELAEDLTARTFATCVPLLDRDGVPDHIRALTSRHVLDVEADLTARLAALASTPAKTPEPVADGGVAFLDATQRDVVAAVASNHQLVVVEGAAGAGKTTTLAAARAAVERADGRLMVVTPTLKAANVAARELDARTSSAAWLAYQHGYRWHDTGGWTRLNPGTADPDTGAVFRGPSDEAMLRGGDLLLVDEAGMLDQDSARALLTIADEYGARVALVGDRHQLPAVGRGGVLDLAVRWAAPGAYLSLDTVHRFIRTTTSPEGAAATVTDEEYARLSLALRAGTDPQDVFDTLRARDQIRVHPNERERTQALAQAAVKAIATGTPAVVTADTREQVATLNDLIRERLVVAGRVDDEHTTITSSGQRIGAADLVATRRNDADLDVANRDTWTVMHVGSDGHVTVAGEYRQRMLPAGYVREHVELAYASTVHGVQGETATSAHMAIGENTTAAAAYVGMTRGRENNVAHLVADSVGDARQQWSAVFGRDRADLGPAHAAQLVDREASRYAQLRPVEQILAKLHHVWTVEEDSLERLAEAERRRDLLLDVVALTRERDATVPALKQAYQHARAAAERATAEASRLEQVVSAHAAEITESLRRAWDEQRNTARAAARTVREGAGRLGQRRGAVHRATEDLAHWSAAWQPYLPTMPTRIGDIVAFADWFDDTPRIHAAFEQHGRAIAEQARTEYVETRAEADTAARRRDEAWRAYHDADGRYSIDLSRYGNIAHHGDPAGYLDEVQQTITATRAQAGLAWERVTALLAEPTLRALAGDRIESERDTWRVERDARERDRYARVVPRAADRRVQPSAHEHDMSVSPRAPDQSPSIGR